MIDLKTGNWNRGDPDSKSRARSAEGVRQMWVEETGTGQDMKFQRGLSSRALDGGGNAESTELE